jgi:hypothetical protein
MTKYSDIAHVVRIGTIVRLSVNPIGLVVTDVPAAPAGGALMANELRCDWLDAESRPQNYVYPIDCLQTEVEEEYLPEGGGALKKRKRWRNLSDLVAKEGPGGS